MEKIKLSKKGKLTKSIAFVFFVFVFLGIGGVVFYSYIGNENSNGITGYATDTYQICDSGNGVSNEIISDGICGAKCGSQLITLVGYQSNKCKKMDYSEERRYCYVGNGFPGVCAECYVNNKGESIGCSINEECKKVKNNLQCEPKSNNDDNENNGGGENGCDLQTNEPCRQQNKICIDDNKDGQGDRCVLNNEVSCSDMPCGSFGPNGEICENGYCPSGESCKRKDGSILCIVDSDDAGPTKPTCNDNIKNQGERDVDCGGPCEACTDYGQSNKCQQELKGTCQDNTSPCSGSYIGGICPGPNYWQCCIPPAETEDEEEESCSLADRLSAVGGSQCTRYADELEDAASKYGVPVFTLAAIMIQESECSMGETSNKGCKGLMQICSTQLCSDIGTAEEIESNAKKNIMCGASILEQSNSGSLFYICKAKTYRGWDAALRRYVGTGCGHLNYVENINKKIVKLANVC